MKLHEFQKKLQASRPVPTFRYQINGNVARFFLAEWGNKYPKEELTKDMQEALDKRYDVYLYDDYGQIIVMGTKANKKTPWRKKLGRSYGYFESLEKALEA